LAYSASSKYQSIALTFIFHSRLFHKIDLDSNNLLSYAELRAFVIGIQFDEIDLDKDDAVEKVMDDFDTSGNENVDEKEFVNGISRWIKEAKRTVGASGSYSKKFIHDFHMVSYFVYMSWLNLAPK